jgi:hypothetical protein
MRFEAEEGRGFEAVEGRGKYDFPCQKCSCTKHLYVDSKFDDFFHTDAFGKVDYSKPWYYWGLALPYKPMYRVFLCDNCDLLTLKAIEEQQEEQENALQK